MGRWLSIAVVCAAGCGAIKVSCEPETCQNGASYTVCDELDGDVEYEFGKQHCTCSITDTTACQTCETNLASYCGGSLSTMSCTAAFSGGVNGSDPACAVSITYDASSNQWTAATAGDLIPATSDTWTGFSITLAGTVAAGSYSQNSSVHALAAISGPDSESPTPAWQASVENGYIIGSATFTLAVPGPSTATATGATYGAPQGSWTGTLTDESAGQPPVTMTVTF